MALQSVRFGVRSRKFSNVGKLLDVWPEIYYLELIRASEGTLSRWFQLAPTNPHWACVLAYDLFSLCVIHKEGMCFSSVGTLIGWWWWKIMQAREVVTQSPSDRSLSQVWALLILYLTVTTSWEHRERCYFFFCPKLLCKLCYHFEYKAWVAYRILVVFATSLSTVWIVFRFAITSYDTWNVDVISFVFCKYLH
jgi:hypothetical protein